VSPTLPWPMELPSSTSPQVDLVVSARTMTREVVDAAVPATITWSKHDVSCCSGADASRPRSGLPPPDPQLPEQRASRPMTIGPSSCMCR
jgi:hypothetical protein